jgi:hypothetical protein
MEKNGICQEKDCKDKHEQAPALLTIKAES